MMPLSFAFVRPHQTLSSRALPFAFGAAAEPPSVRRRPAVAADFAVAYTADVSVAGETAVVRQAAAVLAGCRTVRLRPLVRMQYCLRPVSQTVQPLSATAALRYGRQRMRSACVSLNSRRLAAVDGSGIGHWGKRRPCVSAAFVRWQAVTGRYGQATAVWGVQAAERTDAGAVWQGAAMAQCQILRHGRAVETPCEWYAIRLPESTEPDKRPCGNRPPSNRLPFAFHRRRVGHSARQLPFPFDCGFVSRIPALDHYIMLNTITARCGDRDLSPLAATLRTDMSGYCWSGEMTLPPEDFAALALDGRAVGEEAVLEISINGDTYAFMAEEYSDNRRFGRRSYTVSGRSLTAKLGADYAQGQSGTVGQEIYARQIADAQLAYLGFTIDEWRIADWLVAAGAYTLTDKTPMAVLTELAQAAGGFVCSHPSEPKLSLRPRWPRAAWLLEQTAADVSVPANLILDISGKKQANAQYNGVFVWGTAAGAKAADVSRSGSGGTARAPALSGALYTDYTVCEAAGIAALSDSGLHKTETVCLPLMEKYGLRAAKLGEVWLFAEPSGDWRGVVTGISLEMRIQNDAPHISQTLTVERYLGA